MSLASIILPESVEQIGDSAFRVCTELTSITLSNNVNQIGANAFNGCDKLVNLTFNGTKEEWKLIRKGGGWNSNKSAFQIICSDGKLDKNGNVIKPKT